MNRALSSLALSLVLMLQAGCPQPPSDDADDAGPPDGGLEEPDAGSSDGGDGDGDGAICGQAPGQLLWPDAPWNTSIAAAPLDAESDAIIGYLQDNHDTATRFQIDFSFELLSADDSVVHQSFTPTGDHYNPDCDTSPVPVPDGAVIEGESGTACTSDGDCHLLVIDTDECRLFEMWRANIDGTFEGGCLAVWDLMAPYPETLRGDCCTSADAAGLPIAPHLFTADEVAAGDIHHAIRFILPNAHMRERIYVRPATHSTGATSGSALAPPYGARLRLKADVDTSGLTAGAQVVAAALKTYGMILSDGGNLTFTGLNDTGTTASWDDAQLGPHDLKPLAWSDFEVVELGQRYTWDGACDCVRDPLTE